MIDNRGDFKTYMQNYAYARGASTPRGPRRDGPSDEGFVRLFENLICNIHTYHRIVTSTPVAQRG